MKIYKFRDLTLIDINDSQRLVISCDSAGGIGDKQGDVVKTSQEILGYFTTNVALMEVLSYGAKPITVVNNLCVEMDPSGIEIIKGIKRALKPLNIDCDNIITGSTEENIPVISTGLGITIIGLVDKKDVRVKSSKEKDLVVAIGTPKVGDMVIQDKEKTIMNVERLLKLLKMDYIKEILPVGSKGIEYELGELAETNELNYELFNEIDLDINKSAGPGTCVIATLNKDDFQRMEMDIDIKVTKIGYLKG